MEQGSCRMQADQGHQGVRERLMDFLAVVREGPVRRPWGADIEQTKYRQWLAARKLHHDAYHRDRDEQAIDRIVSNLPGQLTARTQLRIDRRGRGVGQTPE